MRATGARPSRRARPWHSVLVRAEMVHAAIKADKALPLLPPGSHLPGSAAPLTSSLKPPTSYFHLHFPLPSRRHHHFFGQLLRFWQAVLQSSSRDSSSSARAYLGSFQPQRAVTLRFDETFANH